MTFEPTFESRQRPEASWINIIQSEIVSCTIHLRNHHSQLQQIPIQLQFKDTVGSELLSQFLKLNTVAENPFTGYKSILEDFNTLAMDLLTLNSLRDLDPVKLLAPFLNVIKSGDTSGLVTSVALNSLTNFITYKIIDQHHPDVHTSIEEITFAVTRTKFEATDVVSDEIVFSTILKFLRTLTTSEVGKRFITERGMCEITEVAFGMHFQSRISKLLRKDAEDTLIVITQCMFERLVAIIGDSTQLDEAKIKSDNRFGMVSIMELLKVVVGLLDPKDPKHTDTLHRIIALKIVAKALEVGGKSLSKWVVYGMKLDRERRAQNENNEEVQESESEPAIATETKATVVSIGANGASYNSSNPSEEDQPLLDSPKPHLERRQSVLSLIESRKETLSPKDFFHTCITLKNLIIDDLCKQLFKMLLGQNITASMPPTAVSATIVGLLCRCIGSLMCTMKTCLVPQRKWILDYLMEKCADGVHTWDVEDHLVSPTSEPPEEPPKFNPTKSQDYIVSPIREIFINTITMICNDESVYADLFLYHDTYLYCKDMMLKNLLRFYVTFTYPDVRAGEPITDIAHQSLAFDGILHFLTLLSSRRSKEGKAPTIIVDSDRIEFTIDLVEEKLKRKAVYNTGVSKFNDSAKNGIRYFQDHGFLPDPLTPEAMAQFLHTSLNLNKTQVGEYIGKPSNGAFLKAFINVFDFKGKRIDQALRMLLEKFRIPGEAQVIDRIIDAFSIKYFASLRPEETEIASQDATTILAFSVIMLNTDLHNAVVRRRMSFEEYQRNLRGVNNKENFSPEYLKHIYDAIKYNPFVMAEDHGGELGFEHQWKEILKTVDFCPALTEHSNTDTNLFDKHLFASNWQQILNSICYILQNIDDANFFQKGIYASQQLTILAAQFGERQGIDKIIATLFDFAGIIESKGDFPIEQDVLSKEKIDGVDTNPRKKPSKWIEELGKNFRSQIFAVLGFNLTIDFIEHLDKAWDAVVTALGCLFMHQILPIELLTCDHFSRDKVMIPRLLINSIKRRNEESPKRDGFIKTFANFLSITTLEGDEFSNSEAYEAAAKECIKSCGIGGLITESRYCFLIRFMREDSLHKLASALISHSYNSELEPIFTQPSVFFLELLFSVAVMNRDRLPCIWPVLKEHLQRIIKPGVQPLLIERATTNLIRLLGRLGHQDELQSLVFEPLEQLSLLPADTILVFGEHLTAGFVSLAKTNMAIFSKHQSRWNILFRILSVNATHPVASLYSFELTCLVISGHPDSPVTAEHFGECVDLLISYSAGVHSTQVSHKNRIIRTTTTIDSPNNLISVPAGSLKGTMGQALERALLSVEKIFNLHLLIPRLVSNGNVSSKRAWYEFWLPILSGLAQQCGHPAIEIRQQSMIFLQRLLLSNHLKATVDESNDPQHRIDCFDIVLFPMLDDLCKLEASEATINGDSFMRACAMVTKVFLSYSPHLHSHADYPRIWREILGFITRIITSISEDLVIEGIKESIKNVVLVLISDQILKRPTDGEKAELWTITWDGIMRISTEMGSELDMLSRSRPTSPVPKATTDDVKTVTEQPDLAPESNPIDQGKNPDSPSTLEKNVDQVTKEIPA